APAAAFTLDFYANADGGGQGEQYLGSLAATTDAGGQATFMATFTGEVPPGESVTATATDAANDTSEFSGPVVVKKPVGPVTHFLVTTQPPGSATAGTAFALTVTAEDAG